MVNLVSIQFEVGEAISCNDVLFKMTATMIDVMQQQLIHLEVAIVTLNLLPLELVKVIMETGVYSDKVEGISQWLFLVESSVIKPKSNINVLA